MLTFEDVVINTHTMVKPTSYPTNREVKRPDTTRQMVNDWLLMEVGDWMEMGRWITKKIVATAKEQVEFEWIGQPENHCRMFRVCDQTSYQCMTFVMVNINKAKASKSQHLQRIRRVYRAK